MGAAVDLHAFDTRGHNARVVAHKDIAGAKPLKNIMEMLMKQLPVRAAYGQKTATVAGFRRFLRDQLGRKFVIIGIDVEKVLLRH